jgi:hypothetical protein
MIQSFYDRVVIPISDPALNYKWSPAEVNQILFRNFNNPDQAIEELKNGLSSSTEETL